MADRIGIRGRTIEVFVRFADTTGTPVNADATPRVEVTDSGGTVRRALSNSGVSQVTGADGLYKFSYLIPLTGPADAYWTDRWVAVIGNDTVTSSFTFLVQGGGSAVQDIDETFYPGDDYTFVFTKAESDGINKLLKILKIRLKNDGTRKIPDGAGGYTEGPCAVFNDNELICFLVNSLSEFNQWPHFTTFTFADQVITTTFLDVIIQGAVILGLAAQSLIEKGREFVITDQGVSYQPPAVSDMLNTQYGTQLGYYREKLKAIKASLKPKVLGLGGFRVLAVAPAYTRLRHLRSRSII